MFLKPGVVERSGLGSKYHVGTSNHADPRCGLRPSVWKGGFNESVPYGKIFHTIPIRIPKDMGIVWEAYHKGVWLLEAPGITIELRCADRNLWG